MINIRTRAMALAAMLVFCVQIFAPALVLAQSAPPTPTPPSFSPPSVPNVNMSVQSTGEAHAEFPPTGITPNPMPDQGTISAEMVTVLSNAVTSAGNVIIDFGSLPGGVLDHGANNFMNTGTIYAISTNPEITTATIAAQNIFNATGATITTVLPEGGLSGYSNVVASLSLTLAAVESVVNAGTIASAGNLNITAGTSIINALPSVLPSNIMATAPVMQAANNLNLLSPNITNAGMLASIASNINIATQTAQNIIINNVGGTLQAFDSINIRDHNFVGKFDTFLLGGNVLAERLNVYSGDGLAKLQLDVMTPALTLLAGDGYVSTTSDLRIAKVVYTGDPIHISGGDVVFESDVDPITGEKTGIVTGGGTFSGRNARIAPDVDTINISGAIITLSGSANLSSLPINVLSSLKIEAAESINTSSIGAGSAIILVSSGGSVTTGTLSAGDFIQLQAPSGQVTAGSLTSNAGGVIVHGQDIHVGEIKSVNQPGFVDIKAQTPTPFLVGPSADPEGPAPNILSITMTGTSPTGEAWVNIDNPSGVTISSPAAVTISTPQTFSGLSINAQNGTVTLPQGTMTFRGGNFAVSADTILANGTIIDVSSTAGPGGVIFLGATNIDRGSDGLTLNTNGGDNLGSGIGIGGKQSVLILTQFSGVFNQRNISYSGTVDAPFSITGSGPLLATSNGTVNGGNIFIDSLSTATFSGGPMTFSANGRGAGNGGFVQMFNDYIENNVSHPDGIRLSANGAGVGNGGFVQARADRFDANLTVNSDRTLSPQVLTLSATSGTIGGNGGTVDIKAGRMLSVDPDAITTGSTGSGNGNGQRLTIVGGTSGLNGGGITFLQGGTLSNNGKGDGFGGLVQIGAFGDDNDLSYSAQVGQTTEIVRVTAKGGLTGDGGTIISDAGRSLAVRGDTAVGAQPAMDASAGANGGFGGFVQLTARLPEDGGVGTYSQTGRVIADGGGAGDGGFVRLRAPHFTASESLVRANGGSTGNGGTVVMQSYNNLTLTNTAVEAKAGSGGDGQGGFVEIDSGFSGTGDMNISGTVIADGEGNGSGGTVIMNAVTGNVTLNHPAGDTTVMSATGGSFDGQSANGGFIRILAAKNLTLASGDVDVSALTPDGNGGTVILGAGTSGLGRLVYNQQIRANSGTVSGDGGNIDLAHASPESLLVSGNIQADALTDGTSGHITYQNFSALPLFVEVSGDVSANSANGTIGTNFFVATATGQDVNVHVLGTGNLMGGVSSDGRNVNIQVDQSTRTPITRLEVISIANSGTTTITLPSQSSEIVLPVAASSIESAGNITLNARTIENNGKIVALSAGSSIILQNGSNRASLDLKGNGSYSATSSAGLNFIDAHVASAQELRVGGDLTFEGSGAVRFGGHDSKVTFLSQSDIEVTGKLQLTGSKVTLSPQAFLSVTGKTDVFTANLTNEGTIDITGDIDIQPDVTTPGRYTLDLVADGTITASGQFRIFKGLDVNGQRAPVDGMNVIGSVFLEASSIEVRTTGVTVQRGSLWSLAGPNLTDTETTIISTTDNGEFDMLGGGSAVVGHGILNIDMGSLGVIHVGEIGFAGDPDLHATNSLSIRAARVLNGGLIRTTTGDITIHNPAVQSHGSAGLEITNLTAQQPGRIIAGDAGSRSLFVISSGSTTVQQASIRGRVAGSSVANFLLNTDSELRLGNILATDAGIFVSTTHQGIRLSSGSSLQANPSGLDPSVAGGHGRVVLHALDLQTGSIVLEENSSIYAAGTYGNGGFADSEVVTLIVGPINSAANPPSDPLTAPPNFVVGTYPGFLEKGHVFFGRNGISGRGQIFVGGTNPASSAGGIVVFETNGLLPAAITVGGATIVGVLHGGPTDLAVLPPGFNHAGPPGKIGTAPGLASATPGQSGSAPPGQVFTPPGQLKQSVAMPTSTLLPLRAPEAFSSEGAPSKESPSKKTSQLDSEQDAGNRFRAVAFVSSSSLACGVGSVETECANVYAPQDCLLERLDANTFELVHGEVLISANRPLKLKSNGTTIELENGNILLAVKDGNCVRFYDLLDSQQLQISVNASEHRFILTPGQEIEIAEATHDQDDGLARRQSTIVSMGHSTVRISDVSLVSLASVNRTLRAVIGKRRVDSKIASKIEKMAACLMVATARRGAYAKRNTRL